MNDFIKYASNETMTENGALSNVSTLSAIVDQFGKAGSYRGRVTSFVFDDQEKLWAENPEYAVKFPFYLRAITRKTMVPKKGNMSQKGQGARDESFKRLLWLAQEHKDIFEKNIWLLPFVGSWKDIWQLMYYDRTLGTHSVVYDVMFGILEDGLKLKETCDLVKKYMPRIKSNKKCTTMWTKEMNKLAKGFANYLGLSFKEYNHLKAGGLAHKFQQTICAREYDKIQWKQIPGKALLLLTTGKFLENHGLEQTYTDWVLSQDTIKFTGYPFELLSKLRSATKSRYSLDTKIPMHVEQTINKQFNQLIENAKDGDGAITGNVWCALDTSGSMSSMVTPSVTAIDVCMSLGIFFSTLNTGAFHKNVIMFDSHSKVLPLKGEFCDMARQIPMNAMGSTNFQSVVDEIIRIRRRHPEIPIEDYPQTLLVVSDMQFDPSEEFYWGSTKYDEQKTRTNMEACKYKLSQVFPQDFVDGFKFIWWDCVSRKSDYPATIEDTGNYFYSGFDGSIITQLLGGEAKERPANKTLTAEEVVEMALGQDIFKLIES